MKPETVARPFFVPHEVSDRSKSYFLGSSLLFFFLPVCFVLEIGPPCVSPAGLEHALGSGWPQTHRAPRASASGVGVAGVITMPGSGFSVPTLPLIYRGEMCSAVWRFQVHLLESKATGEAQNPA